MSQGYANIVKTEIAATAAAAAATATRETLAAAAADKQRLRGWVPQVRCSTLELLEEQKTARDCNITVSDPFPVWWYTTVLVDIRKRVDGSMPLPANVAEMARRPPCIAAEPEWHKIFARAYAEFGEGTNSGNNRNGRIALDTAHEEILRQPLMGLVGAYKSLLAHQDADAHSDAPVCHYCA